MKSIFTKIEFHYSFLIMALGLVLTGHFVNLLVFSSLIIIHEMGHFLIGLFFKYKVEKIIIFPYGGFTKFDTIINTSIYKDLVVAISGVIVQSFYFFIIFLLYRSNVIRGYIYNLFCLYHKSMIIFNLLPIIPLDGAKIFNLLLSKYFNFNLANKLTVFVSLCSIVIFLFSNVYEKNYSIILVIGILMQNIYKFYSEISYIYNRFLVERYLYNIRYKDRKIISDSNKMYKNKIHYFIDNGKIISEKQFLSKIFK